MVRDPLRAQARGLAFSPELRGRTAWYALATAASQGSAWAAGVLLARGLPTSGFAAYSLFQLTALAAAAYASLGLGVATSRLVAEGTRGRPPPWGGLATLSLGGALLAGASLLALPTGLVTAGLDVSRGLLAAGAAAAALRVVPEGAALGLERYRAITAVAVLEGAARLGAAWLAVAYGAPALAMAGFAACGALKAAGDSVIVVRTVGCPAFLRGAPVGRAELSRIGRIAGPLVGVTLLSATGPWLVGRVILAGGDRAFALYAIGYYWFSLGLWLPGLLGRVLLMRVVRARRGRRDAAVLVRQAVAASIAAAAALAAAALLAGPWVMGLYGPLYAPDRLLIGAYVGAALLGAPTGVLASTLIAADGQKSWLKCSAAQFAVLVGTAVAARGAGAWIGAAAHAAAGACIVVLGYRECRRRRLIE